MNKTTIKISVLAFLGFMTYGYAQQQQQDPYKGKVGVNTIEPSATMDVQPNSDNARVEAKTNEGIIAPKLSKVRIANIATPVEGTLVYATDATYTAGSDATVNNRVAKITEKGYYFYNGTEWVKAGSEATDQLWAQRDNGGVTETYLKPALTNNDIVSYQENRRLYNNLGEFKFDTNTFSLGTNLLGAKDLPFFNGISSDALPMAANLGAGNPFTFDNAYLFSANAGQIKQTHVQNAQNTSSIGAKKSYSGGASLLFTDRDVTGDLGYLSGFSANAKVNSNVNVGFLFGLGTNPTAGDFAGSTNPNVSVMEGVRVFTSSLANSTVSNLIGISSTPVAYKSKNDNIIGVNSLAESGSGFWYTKNDGGVFTKTTLKSLLGVKSTAEAKPNSTINVLASSFNVSKFYNTSNVTHGYGISNHSFFENGATVKDFSSYETGLNADGSVNIDNYAVFKFYKTPSQNMESFNPKRMFGLWLSDINNGTEFNYAIHTGAGNIRFGDLKHSVSTNVASTGDRPVFVTADGVLKIGNASTALSRAVWETDGNHVKLAVKADGTDRTDNIITINDAGQMFASSFMGANGATIFPDYVFQKYYTGTSSIKADYNFKSLSQVEDFVKTNGHLPGYKSAETIKAQGYVDLMETQLTNVEKIEELYLHSIEQDKVNKQQAEALRAKESKIQELEAKNAALESRLERLEKLIQ